MKRALAALLFLAAAAAGAQTVDQTNNTFDKAVGTGGTSIGISSIDVPVNQMSAMFTIGGVECHASSCPLSFLATPIAAKKFWRGPLSGADAVTILDSIYPADLVTSPSDDDMIQVQGGLFAKSSPGTTTELADATTGAENAGTSDKWARADHVHHFVAKYTKEFIVGFPGSAENIGGRYFPDASTITEVRCVLVGSSTPSVTYNIKYGSDRSAAGTSVTTTPSACTNTTSGTTATLNNTAPSAGNMMWLVTTAQSGNVTELEVFVTYTVP